MLEATALPAEPQPRPQPEICESNPVVGITVNIIAKTKMKEKVQKKYSCNPIQLVDGLSN